MRTALAAALLFVPATLALAMPATAAQPAERTVRGQESLGWSVVPDGLAHAATEAVGRARAAVRGFQRLSVEDPTAAARISAVTLWRDLIDALMGALEVGPPDAAAGDALAPEIRNAVLQLDDPAERAARLEALGRIEIGRARMASAARTLEAAWRSVAEIGEAARRDDLSARLAEMAARFPPETIRDARNRVLSISAPEIRFAALQKLARAAMREGNTDSIVLSLLREDVSPDRDRRLLDLARERLAAGLSELAALIALATESDPGARNRLLADIVDREIAWTTEPDDIFAHRAILDPTLSGAASRKLVDYQLGQGRLAQAREAAKNIDSRPDRRAARLAIARSLIASRYLTQAEAMLDEVASETEASGVEESSGSAQALRLEIALQREDADGAWKLWSSRLARRVQPREFGMLAAVLAKAQRTSEIRALEEMASEPAAVAAVITETALAMGRRGEHSRAARTLERIADPGAHASALLRFVTDDDAWPQAREKSLRNALLDEAESRETALRNALLDEAEALIRAAGDKVDDELRADLTDALARLAPRDRAFAAAQLLTPERRYKADVQQSLAVAQALSGEIAAALQRVERIVGEGSRAKAIRAVAEAMFRKGQLREAVALARSIQPWRERVQALHALARRNGLGLEVLADRRPTAAPPEAPPMLLSDGSPPAEAQAEPENPNIPLYTKGRVQFLRSKYPTRPMHLPAMPDLEASDSKAVRAQVPAIAPGRMHVTFLHYSRHNEKFISEVGKLDLVRAAQNTRYPRYLFLESGVFDLPEIVRRLDMLGEDDVLVRTGRDYTMRMPLLIGPDAALVVAGTDVGSFRFGQEASSYLVNAGRIYIVDTEVLAWSEKAGEIARIDYDTRRTFRPFYLAWSGSTTAMTESKMAGFGYQSDKSYGLSFSAGPTALTRGFGAQLPRPTGVVSESLFQYMLYGFYSYEADDVLVVGNTYQDSVVYGVDPHDRSHRLVFAYNTAFGTEEKHGFIGSREVDGTLWLGNVAFDNAGSGLMLDRDSVANIAVANLLFDNEQDGLSIFESSCALVSRNLIFGNARNGALVRNSWLISLRQNEITDNGSNAVIAYSSVLDDPRRDYALDPYVSATSIALADNFLAGPRALINIKDVTAVTLERNRLLGKKLIGGAAPDIRKDLIGWAGRGISMVDACATPVPKAACPLLDAGLILPEPTEFSDERPAVCADAMSLSSAADPPDGMAMEVVR